MPALEFHHRDPNEKEFSLGDLRLKTLGTIFLELDKCDLLCSNCHREVHYKDIDFTDIEDIRLNYKKNCKRVVWPEKEELKKIIFENKVSDIASKYMVDRATVRYWCKTYRNLCASG